MHYFKTFKSNNTGKRATYLYDDIYERKNSRTVLHGLVCVGVRTAPWFSIDLLAKRFLYRCFINKIKERKNSKTKRR
jgi:hypothetical protein